MAAKAPVLRCKISKLSAKEQTGRGQAAPPARMFLNFFLVRKGFSSYLATEKATRTMFFRGFQQQRVQDQQVLRVSVCR
jgi:hypothetical protein